VRSNNRCYACSFQGWIGTGEYGHRFHANEYSEFVIVWCGWAFGIMYQFHYDICTQITSNILKPHFYQQVLGLSFLVEQIETDIMVVVGKCLLADLSTVHLVLAYSVQGQWYIHMYSAISTLDDMVYSTVIAAGTIFKYLLRLVIKKFCNNCGSYLIAVSQRWKNIVSL